MTAFVSAIVTGMVLGVAVLASLSLVVGAVVWLRHLFETVPQQVHDEHADDDTVSLPPSRIVPPPVGRARVPHNPESQRCYVWTANGGSQPGWVLAVPGAVVDGLRLNAGVVRVRRRRLACGPFDRGHDEDDREADDRPVPAGDEYDSTRATHPWPPPPNPITDDHSIWRRELRWTPADRLLLPLAWLSVLTGRYDSRPRHRRTAAHTEARRVERQQVHTHDGRRARRSVVVAGWRTVGDV